MPLYKRPIQSAMSRGRTPLFLLSLVALAPCGAGCATGLPTCAPPAPPAPEIEPDYVRVDYEAQRRLEVTAPAEISDTPVYQKGRASYRTVALRVPNSCLNESAAKATGESVSSRTILNTTCAFWLKELERALVLEGYRVISWDALHHAESAGDMSTYRVASDLGADVVFIINSLESNKQSMSDEAEVAHNYYESNEAGAAIAPKPLSEADRAWLREFVKTRTDAAFQTAKDGLSAHAATLDVTAIVAETGEAVWFYRRSLTRAADTTFEAEQKMSFLFAQWKDHWWPVQPAHLARPIPKAVPADTKSARDVKTSSAGGGPEDALKALELELVRTIVTDFTTNFKGADSAPNTRATTPPPADPAPAANPAPEVTQ